MIITKGQWIISEKLFGTRNSKADVSCGQNITDEDTKREEAGVRR